jgi:hypothetical protein
MSDTLKAPFPWFGGKSRVSHLVWARFGDVANYVEPFFGSGAVLLGRPDAPGTETVNDADCYLANFWRAISLDPDEVAKWTDWPVNEADLESRHRWLVNTGKARIEGIKADPDFYDAQVAGWWVWGLCSWIGSGWCTAAGSEWEQLPRLSGAQGVHRQIPHLGDAGQGVNLKRPFLSNPNGQGIACVTGLADYFRELRNRLRRVRVCCGDWTRVLGDSVTFIHGVTGVFLDPPYSHTIRDATLYATETDCGGAVREWAIAHGDNRLLRIALCGYAGEHDMPDSWECVSWKAHGGMAQGTSRAKGNAHKQRIWFSPHCLKDDLFS